MSMKEIQKNQRFWSGTSPWFIMGAVIILVPIFVFWTLHNINKQKENTTHLLLEKGAALIRSFEAGTRTGMMGMMGMHGDRFQLQRLLTETAQQPDITYLIVTDINGTILAHNDPSRIGGIHGRDLDLERISRTDKVEWRQVSKPHEPDTFEVFRRFLPTQPHFRRFHQRMMSDFMRQLRINPNMPESNIGYIIFVGLDMGSLEKARKEDTRHSVIMAIILFLIGFASLIKDLSIEHNVADVSILFLISSLLVFLFGIIADQISSLRREGSNLFKSGD